MRIPTAAVRTWLGRGGAVLTAGFQHAALHGEHNEADERLAAAAKERKAVRLRTDGTLRREPRPTKGSFCPIHRKDREPRRAERRGDLGLHGGIAGRQTGPVRTPPHPTGPRGGAELHTTPPPPPSSRSRSVPRGPARPGTARPAAHPISSAPPTLFMAAVRRAAGPRPALPPLTEGRWAVARLYHQFSLFFFSVVRSILSSLFLSFPPPPSPPTRAAQRPPPGPGPPRRRPPRARAPSAPPTAAARAPALATGSPRPRPGRGGSEAGQSGVERRRAGHGGKGGPPRVPRAWPMR